MRHSISLARAAIVTGRILLVAIAASAVVAGFSLGRKATTPTGAEATSYACPMHPEVTSPSPRACPICGMDLEPGAAMKSASAVPSTLTLPSVSPELRAFDALAKVKRYDLSLEMRAPAWAETAESGVALFHRDQSRMIAAGESAHFLPSGGPPPTSPLGLEVRATGEPPVRWDDQTDLVRFRVADGVKLVPGRTGSVKFASRLRRDLVIRASAVRYSPEGPYVLVASKDRRTYTQRSVEIGGMIYGHASVVAGLDAGEYVLAKHTFAVDAERRLARSEP